MRRAGEQTPTSPGMAMMLFEQDRLQATKSRRHRGVRPYIIDLHHIVAVLGLEGGPAQLDLARAAGAGDLPLAPLVRRIAAQHPERWQLQRRRDRRRGLRLLSARTFMR